MKNTPTRDVLTHPLLVPTEALNIANALEAGNDDLLTRRQRLAVGTVLDYVASLANDCNALRVALTAVTRERDAARETLAQLEPEYDRVYTALNRVTDQLSAVTAERDARKVCWECPDCAFAFAVEHVDDGAGTHSCPCCAEARLTKERDEARTITDAMIDTALDAMHGTRRDGDWKFERDAMRRTLEAVLNPTDSQSDLRPRGSLNDVQGVQDA